MNNKLILFVVVLLLIGGVIVLSRNQNKTTPSTQEQKSVLEKKDEGISEEPEENEAVEKDEAAGEDMEVKVTATGFEPQTVTVKKGTKVEWENKTDVTVNVSSADHPTHLVYPPLNLGNFEPGKSVELVFDQPGTYKYHDHLHPSKFGSVVVE